MRRRRIPACWKEASSSLVVLLLPGIFLNRHTEERRFPAYSLEMRSRHPAKTSLFRLSSLWLLAFRLDKRLTSLPSLDERAAAARSLFPLFSPPVGWWSPFFMMNGFVLLLLPHNPPLLSCFAHCHIRTFLLLLDRLFLFFRRLDCKLRPWRGSSNQRVPMIKNPARTREKIVIKTSLCKVSLFKQQ